VIRVGEAALPLERAVTVPPDASAVELASRLAVTRQGLALVLDEGRLVGVVSRTDLQRAIALGQILSHGRSVGPFGPVARAEAPAPAAAPPAPSDPQRGDPAHGGGTAARPRSPEA
jgi:hypothetical protein